MVLLLCTAMALILSFPPFPGGPVAMIALVPWLIFLQHQNIRSAFAGGYFIGFLWTAGTIYWIGWATITGLIGAVIYVPLFLGTLSVFMVLLIRRWHSQALWFAPVLWTGMEMIQSAGPLGFPWNQLANTQTHMLPWIQFAHIFGGFGIAFWVVLINVLIAFLIRNYAERRKTFIYGFIMLLLFFLPLIHGLRVMSDYRAPSESLQVTLVQGNIDPYKKWTPSFIDSNFQVYHDLSLMSATEKPGLVVWPETATPCYLRYRYQYLSTVKSIADSMNAAILTGSPDYEWNDEGKAVIFNAALLVHPRNFRVQRYYKNRLVPFSERVPLVDRYPFIYDWLSRLNLDVGRYTPGDSVSVFTLTRKASDPVLFGTAICFDSVFPFHVRKYVRMGARFLTIITNDGWFGHTSGPYQHARIAVIRAIENRRWIIRCANTGISGFIDPLGHFYKTTEFNTAAVLSQDIRLHNDRTWFVDHGHLFVALIYLLNGIIAVTAFFSGRKSFGK